MLYFSIINLIIISLILFSQKSRDFFSPLYIFYYWIVGYFCVHPFVMNLMYGVVYNNLTHYFITLSLMIFVLSYYLMLKFNFDILPNKNFKLSDKASNDNTFVLNRFVLLFCFGLLLYYYLLVITGNATIISAFYDPKAFRYAISNGGNAAVFTVMAKLIFTLPFIYITYLQCINKNVTKTHYVFFIFILIVLALPLGSKGILLSIFINFILIYNYFVKKLSLYNLFFVSLLGFFAFIYLQFSDIVSKNNETLSFIEMLVLAVEKIELKNFIGFVVSRLDLMRNFDFFVNEYVLSNKDDNSFLFSFYSLPQQYIPRSLYADKLYMFSPHMTKTLMPEVFADGVTYDFGSIAESIYNFGVSFFFISSIVAAFSLVFVNKMYFNNNALIGFGFIYMFFARYPISLMSSGFISTSVVVTLPIQIFLAVIIYFVLFKLRFKV